MPDFRFKPTHELLDDDGESLGFYRLSGARYISEVEWNEGGSSPSIAELERLSWTARELSEAERKEQQREPWPSRAGHSTCDDLGPR